MVPRMTKAEMMAEFDRINTAGLRRDELVAFRMRQERTGSTQLYRGRFAVGLSSGTSGNKVLTVLSPGERARYSALLWARSGIPRACAAHGCCSRCGPTTRRSPRSPPWGYTSSTWTTSSRSTPCSRASTTNTSIVLAGPPSLLCALAERADEVRRPIACVVSYAEELDDSARRHLTLAFDAPVVEIYQGAEGMLGVTCPMGSLHLNEDCTLVELDESGDTIGQARRAIITDLYRRTQPFVRYELNDLVELDPSPCPCGSCFRRLRRVHGRADSIVRLTGPGGEVPLMPDYVRRAVNEASDQVLEYQVVQWDGADLEVRLHLATDASRPEVEAAVRHNLAYWASRAGGELAAVHFSNIPPRRDPVSHKLVRVTHQSRG